VSRRAFDRFMVDVELASNPKIGQFTDREFRCLVQGAWTLAAKADPRGYLVVGGNPATAKDVAHQAHCTVAIATATLDKMRELGMLEDDPDECLERCHDWEDYNPAPREDRTNAERQKRFRDRRRAARNGVTGCASNGTSNAPSNGSVTPPEVEVEVEAEVEGEVLLLPPPEAGRQAPASVSAEEQSHQPFDERMTASSGGGEDPLHAAESEDAGGEDSDVSSVITLEGDTQRTHGLMVLGRALGVANLTTCRQLPVERLLEAFQPGGAE
jgi:hypothetical protein